MKLLLGIVDAVRAIRGDYATAPAQALELRIAVDDFQDAHKIGPNGNVILNLDRIGKMTIGMEAEKPPFSASGLFTGGRIYVGSNDKYFYCLNAETGERIFRWPTGADVIGRPITIDRRVFFASLDNFLYALDARSGSQHWAANLPTRPVRGAAQAGDAVLVTGLGSTVQGFRAKNGERLGDITLGGPIAAPPAFITDPELPFPMFLIVSHEIEKGATVTAYARSLEIPQLPLARVTDLIAKTLGATPMRPEQK